VILRRRLLDRRRDLEVARDDPLLDAVHLVDQRLRHRGVDIADADAAVGERELEVLVAVELAVLRYDACESRGIAPIIPVKQTGFVKHGEASVSPIESPNSPSKRAGLSARPSLTDSAGR
jgi:hypothetical protein